MRLSAVLCGLLLSGLMAGPGAAQDAVDPAQAARAAAQRLAEAGQMVDDAEGRAQPRPRPDRGDSRL